MIIQGKECDTTALTRRLFLTVLLVPALLGLSACSSTPETAPGPDYSNSPPGKLLAVFLDNEASLGAVKFTFSGDLQLESGGSHRFRGACGYTNCADLRIQLLGPLGVTLLDYMNVDGVAVLVTNQLTPEGDEDALQGLLDLMEVFTLALVDRCRHPEGGDGGIHSLDSSRFVFAGRKGSEIRFSLDRAGAVLLQQHVSKGSLPESLIEYSGYGWSDDYWMPGEIGIQSPDMPVSITMEISKWTIKANLPAGFFRVP